jgi:intergrase/recombinase
MNETIRDYMSRIGRAGGRKKSKAKSRAAKRNIQKRWAKRRMVGESEKAGECEEKI